eukprot:CAMPEP_0167761670 /NCGR_PEP_ID=MMETSP0110_2-20121227/12309_1 /TAXON_ID=629695 /ORGANISM="Gymnochlora sp., Strain CCMP2014" /LENGTH=290 /DNA_ID=CAMNT_0007648395 /DNA_START=8 /DNA_END=880 /DNA_ORIENTATION=-
MPKGTESIPGSGHSPLIPQRVKRTADKLEVVNDTKPEIIDNTRYEVQNFDLTEEAKSKIESRRKALENSTGTEFKEYEDETGWEPIDHREVDGEPEIKLTPKDIDAMLEDEYPDMRDEYGSRPYDASYDSEDAMMDSKREWEQNHRRPSNDPSAWLPEDTAFTVEGCSELQANGVYIPDGLCFGEWPRFRNQRTGCYMWYSSAQMWHITEKDECASHNAGPSGCKIWLAAKGNEWCPPQDGWYNRRRKELKIRLFIQKSNDTDTVVVNGVPYRRDEFLPPSLRKGGTLGF